MKIPFTKQRRIYLNGYEAGFDKRDKSARKERSELEARDERRSSEHRDRMERINRIEDIARERANQIIARAHADAKEITDRANQKLAMAGRAYKKIMTARDAIELEYQRVFGANMTVRMQADIAEGVVHDNRVPH